MENASCKIKLTSEDIEIKNMNSSPIGCKEKNFMVKSDDLKGTHNENITETPNQNRPVLKVAERVRLHKINGSDITSYGVSHTEVAEHLVSSISEQCDLLDVGTDFRKFEIENERLTSKLGHTRAFNTLLQCSLEENKSNCERLSLLVGKYENNAIALQLALSCSDRIIKTYEELVGILTNGKKELGCVEEKYLLQIIDTLKKERSTIKGTVVELESNVKQPSPQPGTPSQSRILDLETAVLIQELMSMREEKADLNATIYNLEKERENLELKLSMMEAQQTQLATVQHLNVFQESDDKNQDHSNLKQEEYNIKVEIKEMAETLEHVCRHAEVKQQQNADMMIELRSTNSALIKTIEKNKHKYESKIHKLETQMLNIISKHASQVQSLKEKISQLLDNRNNDS